MDFPSQFEHDLSTNITNKGESSIRFNTSNAKSMPFDANLIYGHLSLFQMPQLLISVYELLLTVLSERRWSGPADMNLYCRPGPRSIAIRPRAFEDVLYSGALYWTYREASGTELSTSNPRSALAAYRTRCVSPTSSTNEYKPRHNWHQRKIFQYHKLYLFNVDFHFWLRQVDERFEIKASRLKEINDYCE